VEAPEVGASRGVGMSAPCFLVTGPLIEDEQGEAQVSLGGDLELDYGGFLLVATARKAPVGWTGELCIVTRPVESPVQGLCKVPRFYMDPQTAVQEALLHGIMRVQRGQILDL
jgi:hypothetical protein